MAEEKKKLEKLLRALTESAGVWAGICMQDYNDSRAVPDDLVQMCLDISNADEALAALKS